MKRLLKEKGVDRSHPIPQVATWSSRFSAVRRRKRHVRWMRRSIIRWASDGFTPVEERKEAMGSKTVSEAPQDFLGYFVK
jgi:hypothetical protein